MRTRISLKGQIVLPAEVRRQDQVEAGQEFEVERLDRGDYRLVRRASRPNVGVVDLAARLPREGVLRPCRVGEAGSSIALTGGSGDSTARTP